ncbi:uncharacterized protein LOC110863616 [Folsomia candida]|uniref:uncharacterized protein LOC110863616 n=1 Tax=Folsomia candida TaxID=158441 RepID=UPI000B8F84EF|nr:uncharacterized protein LOC110863616 [Folsomia candida]XP_035710879.1 uncharacterized protein LOC110863616 [Folsomia candida]XP_035710881.1 uncharacterized protein LOC110863616 [Folsomia candida]XP_035710882.1 uncharacterized protein LOC110863616 [Folsomia candida]XP_035710887.1 uncharacterized protein LOC110863616 [Folsomia candida]
MVLLTGHKESKNMATFSISNDAIKQPTRRKAFQKKIGKLLRMSDYRLSNNKEKGAQEHFNRKSGGQLLNHFDKLEEKRVQEKYKFAQDLIHFVQQTPSKNCSTPTEHRGPSAASLSALSGFPSTKSNRKSRRQVVTKTQGEVSYTSKRRGSIEQDLKSRSELENNAGTVVHVMVGRLVVRKYIPKLQIIKEVEPIMESVREGNTSFSSCTR